MHNPEINCKVTRLICFFVNICKNNLDGHSEKYLIKKIDCLFVFLLTIENLVTKIIFNLQASHSRGYDQLSKNNLFIHW